MNDRGRGSPSTSSTGLNYRETSSGYGVIGIGLLENLKAYFLHGSGGLC